jgi:pimeloyl-ACP methyl ester carboxylesterase
MKHLVRTARATLTFVVLATTFVLVPGGVQQARAAANLTLEATYTSVANGWVQVERYLDNNPGFMQEQFPPDGRGDQDGQRLTFFGGVKKPFSGCFLLYYAPGWNTNARTVPVLLVHGANDNADRAWANPNEAGSFGCGAVSCPSTGLMQYLSNDGFRVFAVNFAHKQGDNYMQAQIVADAIQVITSKLGVPQVDVVGWSKGVMSARMYVSSVKPSWGQAYRGDVRRLVLIGGPNKGYDYPFAHGWIHDFSIWPECGGTVNAPAPHIDMTCYGRYIAHPELSIFATSTCDCYPGQRQMLYRWDNVYGVDQTQQDWYTTYYGGQGFYTYGYGIQTAINQGSLITTIRSAGVPSSVRTYLLSGGTPNIPTVYNENRGASDGVVFVASASDTGGIATVGGNVEVVADNHLKLGWETTAMSQVDNWLR